MEYASSVWSPSGIAVCDLVERVQRRFTKRMRGYSNIPYEMRLEKLQLPTLACRKQYHDLLFTYKCLHEYIPIKPEIFGLQLSQAPTRSGGLRLLHSKPKSKALASSFQCRAPIEWSNLPSDVVSSKNVSGFKSKLKKHLNISV